ncbi:uncharacterized protein PAC_10464 [Phialocephala subalpina]|uniref:Uncharacterized protein n=1 Tax=Phialocephala subalpina TaxID=576137 RepID=A0A1L7X6C9_9HELO|nr:uncharacterized protein PAC_10464 [Phialocephala subalpina]
MREKIIEKEAGGGFRLCDGEATKRDFGEEGNVLENRKTLRTGPGGDSRCDSMGFTQGLSNNDREDTQKVYTDNQKLDIEDEVKEKLASTFSFEMVQNFHEIWGKWDGKIPTANAVADLLKEFSIKLHSVAKPGQQKDASVFVRHYRHRIAKKFETCVNVLSQPEECTLVDEVEQGNKHQPQKHAGLGLSLLEKMQLWDDTKSEAATDQKTHPPCLEEEYEEDYAITHSPEVWEFLTKSPAYKWLIEKMKSGALLIEIGGTLMERIGNEITRGLSTVASDHGYNNGVCNGFFEITWDLPAFIGHEYAQESNLQLGSIITITGSSTDAQALSCAEYMRQVWPTTGTETLKVLQDALDKGLGKPHKCCTADKTHITTELHESSICVIVQGTSPAVVEIGQQLAWLGATLRSSISSERMSFSQPIITTVIDKKANFKLSFQVEEISPDGTNFQSTGACWRPLFRNPVIVKGFPILTRHYEEKGLEVLLNMMAGLGQACRATYFAGGLLIKGFSTLFCPSQLIKNSVQWHYLFEKGAGQISYLAADSNCPNRLKLLDLDTTRLARCRNFLGWASSVEIHAGTKGSKYSDIDWPGSSLATPGIAFEKASIIAGSYLSGGASFTRGNKDTPVYIHRGGPYPQEIHSAQNMKVVLYDTRDRVGWLVDGASALLHITRTQLGSSPYSDSEHLRIEDFQHADPKGGPLAAKTALMDQKNRSLTIFEEVETSIESRASVGEGAKAEVKTLTSRWTYQDLVRQTYHILEQLHDYETKILTSPAIGLRFTDRDKLTGFAFMDIVDVQNDLRPRVTTLKSSGRGWVDFTRGIRAITLLGKGFGEIIRPSTDANQLCKNWKHVPTGKDYLVASTSTLKGICRRYGNQDSKPIELANGIHWHKPDKLFEPCVCRSGKTCDRVQVLLPASLGTKKNPQPFGCEKGAVIFGRSMRFPWHWPCKGQPVEGGSSDSEHDDSDFHDSGLGSNLSQSVTIPSPSSSSDTPQV